VLYLVRLANGYHINTLRMCSFYKTVCGRKELLLRVCSTSTDSTHIGLRDKPRAASKRGRQAHSGVSVRAGIVGNIDLCLCLLPDRLIAQRYRNFLHTAQAIILPRSDNPLMLPHSRRNKVSNR